jgi:hypothetical protein
MAMLHSEVSQWERGKESAGPFEDHFEGEGGLRGSKWAIRFCSIVFISLSLSLFLSLLRNLGLGFVPFVLVWGE